MVLPTRDELLEKVGSYRELERLLNISQSQAHKLYNGVHQLSDSQRELMAVKLGVHNDFGHR